MEQFIYFQLYSSHMWVTVFINALRSRICSAFRSWNLWNPELRSFVWSRYSTNERESHSHILHIQNNDLFYGKYDHDMLFLMIFNTWCHFIYYFSWTLLQNPWACTLRIPLYKKAFNIKQILKPEQMNKKKRHFKRYSLLFIFHLLFSYEP